MQSGTCMYLCIYIYVYIYIYIYIYLYLYLYLLIYLFYTYIYTCIYYIYVFILFIIMKKQFLYISSLGTSLLNRDAWRCTKARCSSGVSGKHEESPATSEAAPKATAIHEKRMPGCIAKPVPKPRIRFLSG